MDFMSKNELNYEPIPFTSLMGEKNNLIDIKNVPVEKIGEYAAKMRI